MHNYSLNAALYKALMQNTACITFTPQGIIKQASDQFLAVVGHNLADIKGQHHRIFCDTDVKDSPEYEQFWHSLAAGESQQGRFRRLRADGEELWLEAFYLPICTRSGKVSEIVKIASDVTDKHQLARHQKALIDSLHRSMAVIEFSPDGYIIDANENFEKTMGYRRDDIIGKHHKMFCRPDFYQQQPDFWQLLANGTFNQGRFERLDAKGNSVWLEATYNPVYDADGNTTEVVKFASDITQLAEKVSATTGTIQTAQQSTHQIEKTAQESLEHLDEMVRGAEQAAKTLEQAQALIDALNQQAQSINTITQSIAKIADQTNLLSLNAAVEAARAGEQGRGFAVVASEVRQLAKGSSDAVAQITQLLKDNSALVQRTTKAMQDVVEQSKASQSSVTEIDGIVNHILKDASAVAASIEQLASDTHI